MNWNIQGWPLSARTALLTLLVIVIAYAVGTVARRLVAAQLGALAQRTESRWGDAVVDAVARRIPFWSLLVGLYIAAGFWVTPPNVATAINRALYVAAATSLTFLASEVLVKLVRSTAGRPIILCRRPR